MFSACGSVEDPANNIRPSTRCDEWENVLINKNFGVVYMVTTGCSGAANGVKVAIDVAPVGGTRVTAFLYEDASWSADHYGKTEPTVEWNAPNQLKIAIGAVAAIDKKMSQIGDITVMYEIGHVIKQ